MVPAEREGELPRFLRRAYAAMLVVFVPAVLWLGWFALVLAPIWSALIYAKYWASARTLAPLDGAPPPVRRRELLRAHGSATGRGHLWFSLVGSLLFVATGIWMYWSGERTVTTCVVIGFFALTAVANVIQLSQVR
jgi:hypothetical protein